MCLLYCWQKPLSNDWNLINYHSLDVIQVLKRNSEGQMFSISSRNFSIKCFDEVIDLITTFGIKTNTLIKTRDSRAVLIVILIAYERSISLFTIKSFHGKWNVKGVQYPLRDVKH